MVESTFLQVGVGAGQVSFTMVSGQPVVFVGEAEGGQIGHALMGQIDLPACVRMARLLGELSSEAPISPVHVRVLQLVCGQHWMFDLTATERTAMRVLLVMPIQPCIMLVNRDLLSPEGFIDEVIGRERYEAAVVAPLGVDLYEAADVLQQAGVLDRRSLQAAIYDGVAEYTSGLGELGFYGPEDFISQSVLADARASKAQRHVEALVNCWLEGDFADPGLAKFWRDDIGLDVLLMAALKEAECVADWHYWQRTSARWAGVVAVFTAILHLFQMQFQGCEDCQRAAEAALQERCVTFERESMALLSDAGVEVSDRVAIQAIRRSLDAYSTYRRLI